MSAPEDELPVVEQPVDWQEIRECVGGITSYFTRLIGDNRRDLLTAEDLWRLGELAGEVRDLCHRAARDLQVAHLSRIDAKGAE